MKKNEQGWVGALLVTLAVLFFVLIIPLINVFYVYGTQKNVTLDINKTERIVERDGSGSKYLIYTKEGVYENTDTLLRGKFNSSDVYNQLEAGKKYNCDTYGWRMPFFSSYPNIVSCQETK